MNAFRYLFDENVPIRYLKALRSREPAIEFRQVGVETDSPPKRTEDPDVLTYAEREHYAIVSFDLDTFPDYAVRHVMLGRMHHGVFVVPRRHSIPTKILCDELIMIWAASDPVEWVNRVAYIPLKPNR